MSVRALFGIQGPRTDNVTGEELSPGQQFRMMVLRNQNLSPDGSLTIRFSTNLQPGNGLWSTNICNDRIRSVQAQLVGDFQGDNEAEVKLVLSGAATQRACDGEEIRVWPLGSSPAIIQAGVNTFGEAPPNTSLFGQAVARATWDLTIMGGDTSPANQDIDLTKLEDIVLKVSHEGIPTQSTPQALSLSCLTSAL